MSNSFPTKKKKVILYIWVIFTIHSTLKQYINTVGYLAMSITIVPKNNDTVSYDQ